jgi:hypothetical protein
LHSGFGNLVASSFSIPILIFILGHRVTSVLSSIHLHLSTSHLPFSHSYSLHHCFFLALTGCIFHINVSGTLLYLNPK